MNVFLCWSGSRSERVAKAMRDWLGDVIHALQPFMSNEDINKGERWRTHIAEQLAVTDFGILCLTADNLDSRWILFEAGALSKHLQDGRVTALLIGIDATQVVEPLSQFQATAATSDDIFKLVKQLNQSLKTEQQLTPERLQRMFDKHWPDLKRAIDEALEEKATGVALPRRPPNEMIEEILTLVRELKRSNSIESFWAESARNNSGFLADSVTIGQAKSIALNELMKGSLGRSNSVQNTLIRPPSATLTLGESLLDDVSTKPKEPGS
jgi:hypothetical protein